LIFLQTTLDGKPAQLLLDTGSNVSFSFATGSYVRMSGERFKTTDETAQRVVFRYPDELKTAQGIVGQDVLREFSAVRIDYKASVIEFEK